MKNKLLLSSIIAVITTMLAINDCPGQIERKDIEDKYKWDMSDLYQSDDDWNAAKDAIIPKIKKIDTFKGKLLDSPENLFKALEYSSEVKREIEKLALYASMKSALDTRDMMYLGMRQEIQQIMSDYKVQNSFFKPEILSADWQLIARYLEKEPVLKPYDKMLKDMFRMKEHIPGESEGRIIALSEMVSSVPKSVFNTFKNAEMPNPRVILSDGTQAILSVPGYARYRSLPNRDDRTLVFESFFANLANYEATLGELLYGAVKKDVFLSRSNNYNSSLEAALYPNNIPVEVYHALIDNMNRNLPSLHRYLHIKKRMMNLDTLKYTDLYASAVRGVELDYDYKEAREILSEAFAPLGTEYTKIVNKAFNERWIDVYPSTGKRSGAFSTDCYDGHPYILVNYNDKYDDLTTVAHEMGHTMHSYYSIKSQPYPKYWYPIFVAEVASTFNEVLLFHYVMNALEDDNIKLSLLMEWLNVYRTTLFRQTHFAEFELKIHEAVEKGIALTGEIISEIYLEILRKYYGHDSEVCIVDDYFHMEWAFIPHFYNNYYVYQYSTSFSASISLAKQVLEGKEGAREGYLEFLAAGASEHPIDLLKKAGVDMTGSEVFNSTVSAMNELMDEIEEILDRMEK